MTAPTVLKPDIADAIFLSDTGDNEKSPKSRYQQVIPTIYTPPLEIRLQSNESHVPAETSVYIYDYGHDISPDKQRMLDVIHDIESDLCPENAVRKMQEFYERLGITTYNVNDLEQVYLAGESWLMDRILALAFSIAGAVRELDAQIMDDYSYESIAIQFLLPLLVVNDSDNILYGFNPGHVYNTHNHRSCGYSPRYSKDSELSKIDWGKFTYNNLKKDLEALTQKNTPDSVCYNNLGDAGPLVMPFTEGVVNENTTVSTQGIDVDSDNPLLTFYSWQQPDAYSLVIENNMGPKPVFKTPTVFDDVDASLQVTAWDPFGRREEKSFPITIKNNVNEAPTVEIQGPSEIKAGEIGIVRAYVHDDNPQDSPSLAIDWNIPGKTDLPTESPVDDLLSISVPTKYKGEALRQVIARADDGHAENNLGKARHEFLVPNSTPTVIIMGPKTVMAGSTATFSPLLIDPDPSDDDRLMLVWDTKNLTGMKVITNADQSLVVHVPKGIDDETVFRITAIVTDGRSQTAIDEIEFTVIPIAVKPEFVAESPPIVSQIPVVAQEPIVAPEPAFGQEPAVAPEPASGPEPAVAPEPAFGPEPVVAPEPAVGPLQPDESRDRKDFKPWHLALLPLAPIALPYLGIKWLIGKIHIPPIHFPGIHLRKNKKDKADRVDKPDKAEKSKNADKANKDEKRIPPHEYPQPDQVELPIPPDEFADEYVDEIGVHDKNKKSKRIKLHKDKFHMGFGHKRNEKNKKQKDQKGFFEESYYTPGNCNSDEIPSVRATGTYKQLRREHGVNGLQTYHFDDSQVPQKVRQAGQNVVAILDESNNLLGSATIASDNGDLLSAMHVFDMKYDISQQIFKTYKARLSDGTTVAIQPEHLQEGLFYRDYIWFRVPELKDHAHLTPSYDVKDAHFPKRRKQVWYAGYPAVFNQEGNFSSSNPERFYTTGRVVKRGYFSVVNTAIPQCGYSGGALLDSTGHYVGITSQVSVNPSDISRAMTTQMSNAWTDYIHFTDEGLNLTAEMYSELVTIHGKETVDKYIERMQQMWEYFHENKMELE